VAFSLNSRGSPRSRYRPLSEINVTPLVDVMLVLLIVFMVTAPLMTTGVSVDLPKTNAQPLNNDSRPLTVSIRANGDIYLQDEPVPIGDVVEKLKAIALNNPDRRIFVRGDKDLPYGRIMEVMGTITQGGFSHVALLAEQTGSVARAPGASPGSASPASPSVGPASPLSPSVGPTVGPRSGRPGSG
jgi:biopolymer transport protein TolR